MIINGSDLAESYWLLLWSVNHVTEQARPWVATEIRRSPKMKAVSPSCYNLPCSEILGQAGASSVFYISLNGSAISLVP